MFWVSASQMSHAIVDKNSNNLSDVWEKLFNNGTLFPNSFNLMADPDGDGWNNLQEATAGTNPFDPNPPEGFLVPTVAHVRATYDTSGPDDSSPVILEPARYLVTWPTLLGKTYRVTASTDLSPQSWVAVSETYVGDGEVFPFELEALHSDGSIPERLFWRVVIGDTDSDADTLNDWEEGRLFLDPFSPDRDKDGQPDSTDPQPLINSLASVPGPK